MKQRVAAGFALTLVTAVCGNVHARPVTYTAYAVTDGQLGSLKFSDSPVSITFRGDTSDVSMSTSSGVVQYRIDNGDAMVTVTVQGVTTVARIDPWQIYVHYDVQAGIVGFGSNAVGPAYPLTMSCSEFHACNYQVASGFSYGQIVSAIADADAIAADSSFYSGAVGTLPQTLTESTLLTGYASACAVPYVVQSGVPPCASAPTTLIHTSLGDFYLQDATVGKGIFTVDVGRESDD